MNHLSDHYMKDEELSKVLCDKNFRELRGLDAKMPYRILAIEETHFKIENLFGDTEWVRKPNK